MWFDHQAEDAARFYCTVFPRSKITAISRYSEAGQEVHHRPPGSVMTVAFELDGQPFSALNGGPVFKLTEAVSFEIHCETQAEIDQFWGQLSEGGDPKAQQCGWLKDRFGLSWQVIPAALPAMMANPDPAKVARTMTAMLKMKRLDLAALRRAHDGEQ